jgi:perosamine synthetase
MLHEFAKAGIDTRQFFSPLSMIADLNDGTVNPVAQAMPDQAINLPSFHDITSEQLSYVVDTVNRLVKEFDRS